MKPNRHECKIWMMHDTNTISWNAMVKGNAIHIYNKDSL